MHIFFLQQSIDSGEIPKEWSLANICPLFKKGDRYLTCNYRPVSLTCVACKLLEHIVCSNIMSHLDHHTLLSDRQHAFRKSHSCETQLATVRAFVVFSNGKNGTIGRQIPFKVLPMVPLVMPLVPMVPMLPTYGSKWCRQNTAWVILPTREKSRDSIWRA